MIKIKERQVISWFDWKANIHILSRVVSVIFAEEIISDEHVLGKTYRRSRKRKRERSYINLVRTFLCRRMDSCSCTTKQSRERKGGRSIINLANVSLCCCTTRRREIGRLCRDIMFG